MSKVQEEPFCYLKPRKCPVIKELFFLWLEGCKLNTLLHQVVKSPFVAPFSHFLKLFSEALT